MVREITELLIEMAEDGMISWETIARSCMGYMSEDDVADMADSEGLLDIGEDDDDFSFEDDEEVERISGLGEDETIDEILK